MNLFWRCVEQYFQPRVFKVFICRLRKAVFLFSQASRNEMTTQLDYFMCARGKLVSVLHLIVFLLTNFCHGIARCLIVELMWLVWWSRHRYLLNIQWIYQILNPYFILSLM